MIESPQMLLQGRRINLRPLVPGDFSDWSEVRKRCGNWLTQWEPRVLPGLPDVVEDVSAFAARCNARDRERQMGSAYGFGLFVGDKFGGEVNLSNIQRGPFQNAYIGYWIDEAIAGQGFTPEALVVLFRFAFEELGLHRLQMAVVPRNKSSLRVMEKLQLREEGIAMRYLEINGVWEDHIRYAITVEDWADRREGLLSEWIDQPVD